jgi:hypothetical protein
VSVVSDGSREIYGIGGKTSGFVSLKPIMLKELQLFGRFAEIFAELLVGGFGWPHARL